MMACIPFTELFLACTRPASVQECLLDCWVAGNLSKSVGSFHLFWTIDLCRKVAAKVFYPLMRAALKTNVSWATLGTQAWLWLWSDSVAEEEMYQIELNWIVGQCILIWQTTNSMSENHSVFGINKKVHLCLTKCYLYMGYHVQMPISVVFNCDILANEFLSTWRWLRTGKQNLRVR